MTKSTPTYTVDDMARGLHALMPRGAVWPRDESSVQHQVMKGLAGSFARSAGRSLDLLVDANPATSYELLPEWELTMGLPGLCGATAGATIQDRQRAVVTALTDTGGQSKDYFIKIAETLGYTITISEFKRFTVSSTVVDPITDAAWSHAWQINGAAYRVTNFSVSSAVDELLSTADNFNLGCVLQRIKPAHTTLVFNLA